MATPSADAASASSGKAGTSNLQPQTFSAQSRPDVAVLVVIFTVDAGQLQVLLIRRSAEPFKDFWSLPGGLLAAGESLDDAAVRKLDDETGLADVFLEQLYTFCDLDGRGPRAAALVPGERAAAPGLPERGRHRLRPAPPARQAGLLQRGLLPPARRVHPVP